MNRARVAALLRELADAVEADDEGPVERPSRPRKKTRAFPAPISGQVSDVDRARAKRMLRDRGM